MIADVVLGALVGLICGVVFFGGLRWTVARLDTTRRPVALVVSSLVLRVMLVAGALVVISDGRLARVLAGLAGLLVIRTAMVAVARRELSEMEVTSWT